MAGCVVKSITPANSERIGEIDSRASRFDGRFLVSRAKNACCFFCVSHFKKAIALSLRGELLLTTNDDPAPPQMRMGRSGLTGGGSIAPCSRSEFMSWYTLTHHEPLNAKAARSRAKSCSAYLLGLVTTPSANTPFSLNSLKIPKTLIQSGSV